MPGASPTAVPPSAGLGPGVSDALPSSVLLELGAIFVVSFALLILAAWYTARRDRAA